MGRGTAQAQPNVQSYCVHIWIIKYVLNKCFKANLNDYFFFSKYNVIVYSENCCFENMRRIYWLVCWPPSLLKFISEETRLNLYFLIKEIKINRNVFEFFSCLYLKTESFFFWNMYTRKNHLRGKITSSKAKLKFSYYNNGLECN